MEHTPSAELIQPGWYWHPHSQRPAYVYQEAAAWRARILWTDPDRFGALQHDGLLNSVSVDLPLELYLQLVPLFRRLSIDQERRRTPVYPLVRPCQHCGRLTPSSFIPVGDGTWIARPRCEQHQEVA